MYLSEERFEKDNPDYVRIERKPWNVREGDVLLLTDSTDFHFTKYIPVEIHTIDRFKGFYRQWWTTPYRTSRTDYRMYHKPLKEDDRKYLYDWWSTNWNSLDTVEIYRKVTKKNKRDKS